jgi:hypothetical protein
MPSSGHDAVTILCSDQTPAAPGRPTIAGRRRSSPHGPRNTCCTTESVIGPLGRPAPRPASSGAHTPAHGTIQLTQTAHLAVAGSFSERSSSAPTPQPPPQPVERPPCRTLTQLGDDLQMLRAEPHRPTGIPPQHPHTRPGTPRASPVGDTAAYLMPTARRHDTPSGTAAPAMPARHRPDQNSCPSHHRRHLAVGHDVRTD